MTLELSILLVCIVGSAISSGSETALVSVSRLKLRHLASEGRRGASVAVGLLGDRDRILAVTLVMTNIFTITAGAVATAMLERELGAYGSIAATLVMTSILLVLSEIVPKAYFRHHPETTLMGTASAWRVLAVVLTPITYPIDRLARLLFKVFRHKPRSLFVTREEIRLVLEDTAELGGLRQMEQDMLESTLDYGETTAKQVMVPIAEVAMLPDTAETEALLDLVREQGFTRVPVYHDRVDRIVGQVNVFDVLYDPEPSLRVKSFVRPARLVPDTKPIGELFVEMQRERESLVVVVNEFGACFGIVSTEDIIEEIFGELADEHEDATPEIQPRDDGAFVISPRAAIDDVADETGWQIPKAGFETMGGYVNFVLGRIPQKGEVVEEGRLVIEIADADRYGAKEMIVREREREAEE